MPLDFIVQEFSLSHGVDLTNGPTDNTDCDGIDDFFYMKIGKGKFGEDHIYTSNTLKRLNNELYNDDLGKIRVIARKIAPMAT